MPAPDRIPYCENEFFQGIPRDQLAALHLDLPVVAYEPGAILFDEGAGEDCCYLVESGSVRISKAGAAGQETLGFIGPGSFFGEIALFHSGHRTARATAATPVTVAVLRRDAFMRLRSLAPLEVTTTIANVALQHLHNVNAHLVQQLENADRFRDIGTELGAIAHDLRSPLATVRSAAELLLEALDRDPLDVAQLRRFVEMIHRTASRGLAETDELLAHVRGERLRATASVDLAELVHDVTTEVQGLLAARNGVFEAAGHPSGRIVCERAELARALLNLIRNAAEALPEQGGRIVLRASVAPDAAIFVVEDNGRGIPADLQGRIFERRFTHGKAGGTGLGLAQVRKVVERHGGRIRLDSREGAGTTFTIELPQDPARET